MNESRYLRWYRGEKGYPWVSLPISSSSRKSLLVFMLVILLGSLFALWYLQTGFDSAPDSLVGYLYAFIGIGFFLAALLSYRRKRQSHQRGVGQLNAALNWHTLFGLLGLFFLMLHSFGNFNPRSGTYALYGMIALTLSGVVGRVLDRFLPRLATKEVHLALTAQGEDRVDSITRQLEALSSRSTQRPTQGVLLPSVESTYWLGDPAAVLETLELQTPLRQQTGEHILALKQVQQAMMREQLYRHVIRTWRVFHKMLALVTVGLTIWHIVYALQLLL